MNSILQDVIDSNGVLLKCIEQTPEICLAAVQYDFNYFKYIKTENQTPEMCEHVLQYDGSLLKYIENQTPKMCFIALKEDSYNLMYVHEQTPELCLFAVEDNGMALQYVRHQTQEICNAAIADTAESILFVKKQFLSLDMCKRVARTDGYWAIWAAKKIGLDSNIDLVLTALQSDGTALELIHDPTFEMCLVSVKNYSTMIPYIEDTFDFSQEEMNTLYLEAIRSDVKALVYIAEHTSEMVNLAFSVDPVKSKYFIRNLKLLK